MRQLLCVDFVTKYKLLQKATLITKYVGVVDQTRIN